MNKQILLIDISNGIYAKLAIVQRAGLRTACELYTANSLDELKQAISAFLAAHDHPEIGGAAISAGGWDENGVMSMPNHPFSIRREDFRELLGISRVNLVNDCVAKALAVPYLELGDLLQISGGEVGADLPRALINVTNGLGVATIVPDAGGSYTVFPTEGGHSDLPATEDSERMVYGHLSHKYGHVSRERVISLPGLTDLWNALANVEGSQDTVESAGTVCDRARAGDPRAQKALTLATGWLGATVSDIALVTGARGGIYLAGEWFDAVGELFDLGLFADKFRTKGRLSGYVSDVPIFLVLAKDIEIIGLSTLFDP